MLSHVERVESRAASLLALQHAGVRPEVVISHYRGSTPDAEVRARAFDALTLAEGRALVFFEDDIDVRPELFQRHVRMAERADTVTAFCAVNERHYPRGIIGKASHRAQLVGIPNYNADRGFHGSMALYVPPAMVAFALGRRSEFQQVDGTPLSFPVIEPDRLRGKVTGFDFWVKHHAAAFNGMLVAVPNSVQHVDRRGRWYSPTFNMEVA